MGICDIHKPAPKTWAGWEGRCHGHPEVGLGSWLVGFEGTLPNSNLNFYGVISFSLILLTQIAA